MDIQKATELKSGLIRYIDGIKVLDVIITPKDFKSMNEFVISSRTGNNPILSGSDFDVVVILGSHPNETWLTADEFKSKFVDS